MNSTIRETLEEKIGCLMLIVTLGIGVESCIYKPIRLYSGLTKSMKEVSDFQSRGIADKNNDGILSEEERRIRDNFYEECKSHSFEIGLACYLPTKSLDEESKRIFLCIEEKYKPKKIM